MEKIAFYMHSGSGNHGCEAIIDTLTRMVSKNIPENEKIRLVSWAPEEDKQYLPKEVQDRLDIVKDRDIRSSFATHVLLYGYRKITGDRESFLRYKLKELTGSNKPELAVSIGGDNYCYDSMTEELMLANSMLNRQGTKTILLGCSVEPELLKTRQDIVRDMQLYTAIIARETITYNALLSAGIPEEKVYLCPDPAFTLPVDTKALPEGFEPGNTVGINLSPMVEDYASDRSIAAESVKALIREILDTSGRKCILIPHVVWGRSDDRGPLQRIFEEFKDTGRVLYAPDLPAEKLKGIISSCCCFIGARTHATIAAYSSLVPTLVIGYSVKARGIAEDLFGTSEQYVLPVQSLKDPAQLTAGYRWLRENEGGIRAHLKKVMPSYRERALRNGELIAKFRG